MNKAAKKLLNQYGYKPEPDKAVPDKAEKPVAEDKGPEWKETHPRAWELRCFLAENKFIKMCIVDCFLSLRLNPPIDSDDYKNRDNGRIDKVNKAFGLMWEAEDELSDLLCKDLISIPFYEHATSTSRID